MTDRFTAKFTEEQAKKATRMEWWGSSFNDPGGDWNEFILFDGDKVIAKKQVAGY